MTVASDNRILHNFLRDRTFEVTRHLWLRFDLWLLLSFDNTVLQCADGLFESDTFSERVNLEPILQVRSLQEQELAASDLL